MRLRSVLLLLALVVGILSTGSVASADDPNTEEAPVCGTSEPTTLWPPNHKWKTVPLPTATDPEGGTLTASAPTVKQDEPVNGEGDGNTAPDARLLDDGTLQVRAERAGPGDGRFYYVSVTFTDTAGLETTCTSVVVVPHDKGKKKGKGGGAPVDSGPPYYDSFSSENTEVP